jgi:hypothetical protein
MNRSALIDDRKAPSARRKAPNTFQAGGFRGTGAQRQTGTETRLSNTLSDYDFLLSERARYCISTMLGFNSRDTEEEENKTVPDPARIGLLEAQRDRLLAERAEIYRGDRETQKRCLDAYNPIIRERPRPKKPPERRLYKLSPQEHAALFRKLERDLLKYSTPSAAPRAVIIGGQPGAGMAAMIRVAMETILTQSTERTKNVPAVVIDEDYREEHPLSGEILSANERRCAEETDSDVRGWGKRLLSSAMRNRRDILFEGDMSNGGQLLNIVNRLKEEGYRVDVMVMAAGSEFSRLGILQRYEGQRADSGYGRWTSVAAHGKTYDRLPETVKLVELKCCVDSFRVYNRAGEVLYTNAARDGVYTKPPLNADARAAIMKERRRSLTPEEQSSLQEGRRRVLENMKRRGAAPEDMTRAMAILGNVRQLRQELL